MRLIHYGDLSGGLRNAAMGDPARRNSFNKPRHDGILWASPEGSAYGWREWCQSEEFGDVREERRWVVELSPAARVFTVDALDDLICLEREYRGELSGRYGSITDIDWVPMCREWLR